MTNEELHGTMTRVTNKIQECRMRFSGNNIRQARTRVTSIYHSYLAKVGILDDLNILAQFVLLFDIILRYVGRGGCVVERRAFGRRDRGSLNKRLILVLLCCLCIYLLNNSNVSVSYISHQTKH